jgi:hypothetical protein
MTIATEPAACKKAHIRYKSTSQKAVWRMRADSSGQQLNRFIVPNNLALMRFSASDRKLLGVHTCSGGDRDSTHGADAYAEFLPAFEKTRARVLGTRLAERKLE